MDIASYIDHTLLKPTADRESIRRLCGEALEYRFASVCVPPYYVAEAARHLSGSGVKTGTVIGFPFGYSVIASKTAEVAEAIADGADELDMVICLAALKNGNWDYLGEEIGAISSLVAEKGKLLKVIIESGILSDHEIIRCTELYQKFRVQFLKTSTGYAERGATIEAVRLMRSHLPSEIRIKASGGIRTLDFARSLIEAGAARLGCSAGIQLAEEAAAHPGRTPEPGKQDNAGY